MIGLRVMKMKIPVPQIPVERIAVYWNLHGGPRV